MWKELLAFLTENISSKCLYTEHLLHVKWESLKTLHDWLLPYGDSDIIIVHFVFEGIIALFENLPTP
jgi:hypothetical protein